MSIGGPSSFGSASVMGGLIQAMQGYYRYRENPTMEDYANEKVADARQQLLVHRQKFFDIAAGVSKGLGGKGIDVHI